MGNHKDVWAPVTLCAGQNTACPLLSLAGEGEEEAVRTGSIVLWFESIQSYKVFNKSGFYERRMYLAGIGLRAAFS